MPPVPPAATGDQKPARLNMEVGMASDTSAATVPSIEDLTPMDEGGAPSSCIAFVVTSRIEGGGLIIAAVPEAVTITSRSAFLDMFQKEEEAAAAVTACSSAGTPAVAIV